MSRLRRLWTVLLGTSNGNWINYFVHRWETVETRCSNCKPRVCHWVGSAVRVVSHLQSTQTSGSPFFTFWQCDLLFVGMFVCMVVLFCLFVENKVIIARNKTITDCGTTKDILYTWHVTSFYDFLTIHVENDDNIDNKDNWETICGADCNDY